MRDNGVLLLNISQMIHAGLKKDRNTHHRGISEPIAHTRTIKLIIGAPTTQDILGQRKLFGKYLSPHIEPHTLPQWKETSFRFLLKRAEPSCLPLTVEEELSLTPPKCLRRKSGVLATLLDPTQAITDLLHTGLLPGTMILMLELCRTPKEPSPIISETLNKER